MAIVICILLRTLKGPTIQSLYIEPHVNPKIWPAKHNTGCSSCQGSAVWLLYVLCLPSSPTTLQKKRPTSTSLHSTEHDSSRSFASEASRRTERNPYKPIITLRQTSHKTWAHTSDPSEESTGPYEGPMQHDLNLWVPCIDYEGLWGEPPVDDALASMLLLKNGLLPREL